MKKELLYGPTALLALWYAIYGLKLINPLFLPSPHSVIMELFMMLKSWTAWTDIFASVIRIVAAFCIAGLIGIPLGLLMGRYEKVRSALELLVDFCRSLPALAIFPLLMFVLGIGEAAKLGTAAFACSLVIAVNAAYGVTASRKTRQIVAALLEANRYEIFWRVILFDALPQIFVGLRTSLSLAAVIIIATEMFVGTSRGIGHRIFEAQLAYRGPELYASIIIAGLIGYTLNKGFVFIEQRATHWSGK